MAKSGSGAPRVVGLIAIIMGVIFVVAGIGTWTAVSVQLNQEKVTVSEGTAFAGQRVNSPWTAFSEANIIREHALKATGGLTYGQLKQGDPLQGVAGTASFLRSSLFTSVVAYGVALLVVALGALFILIGWVLRILDSRQRVVPAVAPVMTA